MNTMPGGESTEEFLKRHAIETVECCFADLWGIVTGRKVPVDRFLKVAHEGFSMPNAVFAWSVQGDIDPLPFTNPDTGYPNLRMIPDLSSLRVAPWENSTAICFMDAKLELDGEPHPLDPRGALKRATEAFADLGFEPLVAPELEFYVCEEDWTPVYSDHRPWSMTNAARLEPLLGDIRRALLEADVPVESSQTEYGPGQFEINIAPSDAVNAADRATLLRYVVKLLARRHKLRATFMPMPFQGASGSGHHLHLSLLRDGSNHFATTGSSANETMTSFIAGVLSHLQEMTAVNLPSVNAYKRLLDYTFAPNRVSWAFDNRTAAVRVPPDTERGSRIELRTASSDANPYLIVAAALASGGEGLANKSAPPPPIDSDAYKIEDLPRLPGQLLDAVDAFEHGALSKRVFGPILVETLSTLARNEAAAFARHVTDWERDRYLEPC